MQNFYQIVIYFALFSVAGWVVETIFCSIKDRKFVYRGFLNGPVCPVYGFGGLIVVYLLVPFQGNTLALFLAGMVATSALEYVTHYLMEKLFHAKWWDYSHLPFNLNGRICLQFSILFGFLSVAAVRWIYPPFEQIMEAIPLSVQPLLAWVLLALFVADTAVTTWGILRLNGALAEVEAQSKQLIAKLEAMGEDGASLSQRLEVLLSDSMSLRELKDSIIANYTPEQKQQAEETTAALVTEAEQTPAPKGFSRFQIKRITRAFPRMESTKYREYLSKLKNKLTHQREE